MQKILYNAKVYVEKENYQEAVLIEDGTIKAVGSNGDIYHAADSSKLVKSIDCEGRTLVPGFNDTHMHLMMLGETRNQAQIEGVQSISQMIDICRRFEKDHPEVRKKGMHAIGWNQDLFTDERRLPDRHDLDQISTEYPIVLERICGHIVSVNSKAIEMLNLPDDTHGMKDGDFLFGDDGVRAG